MNNNPTVSVVLPCLNEAETLAACIRVIRETLDENHIDGEIIVADNGSIDESTKIAIHEGARVVQIPERGYGHALIGGINESHGKYIIMGDADMSYDFREIPNFLTKLQDGYDLVMGNRFAGGIRTGAMPWSHRVIGNPLLTGIGRLFFKLPIKDAHCGLRGFSRDAFNNMKPTSGGMEFASEMIVRASLLNMRITEIPIVLYPDGRSGEPHLKTIRDGWRHLKFLLLFSPRWLFFYPGMFIGATGLILLLWLLPEPRIITGSITLDIHTMLVAMLAVMLGTQLVSFAVLSRIFATHFGCHPHSRYIQLFNKIWSPERGIFTGAALSLIGIISIGIATAQWGAEGFSMLNPSVTMRTVIPGTLLVLLGIQITFTSFFLNILSISYAGDAYTRNITHKSFSEKTDTSLLLSKSSTNSEKRSFCKTM